MLILTCMDCQIDPLTMVGLTTGDAKVLRTPGARLTPGALIGCILGVHRLSHPLISSHVLGDGFTYQVETGRLLPC